MIEELYEVFDTETKEVLGTNMDKNVALILIDALYGYWHNQHDLSLGIRKTDDTVKQLMKDEQ